MSSPQVPNPDNNSNTKSEEKFNKKRQRRVSFAETTLVRIFNRDEYSGSPDKSPPVSPPSDSPFNQPNRMFWNDTENDNDNDNDEENDPGSGSGPQSPFLRLVGSSPSSGGSTVGSATSNDEDNFFGPVSTSFIRRELLDSEVSEGDHDQTMDSTAFSMHFRNLARAESEVELKTSTGVNLSFDEKTPSHDSIPTNTGTLMQMTVPKNLNNQPSVSSTKLSSGSESNDMSIVGDYRNMYNYGKLSPTLDALLAEARKDSHVIISPRVSILKSPRNAEATQENVSNLMDFSLDEANHLQGIIAHEMVNEVASYKHNEFGAVNDGSEVSPTKQIGVGISFHESDIEISKHVSPSSSIMATPSANNKETIKDAFQMKSSLDFSAYSHGNSNPKSNPIIGIENKFPSKSPLMTPLNNHSSVSIRAENPKYGWSVPFMQKSISKLNMLEASPFSAALNAKLEDSTFKMTPSNTLLVKNYKASLPNSLNGKRQLLSSDHMKRGLASSTNMDDIRRGKPVIQNFVKVASPLLIPPESTESGAKSQTDLLSLEDKNKFGSSENFDYCPQKKLKSGNASEFTSSSLKNAKQFPQHNEPGHFEGSGEIADKADAMDIERIEKSTLVMPTEEEMVDDRDVHYYSETMENSTTPLKAESLEKLQTNFVVTDIASGETKRASMVLHDRTDEQSCQKNLHDDLCQSPSNKHQPNTLHDGNVHILLEENVLSSNLHHSLNGNVVNERARKAEDVMVETTAITQRGPNISKDHASSELSSENTVPMIGHSCKNPIEMIAMLSKETKELLPQSLDKLNLHAIDRLAGIMDQLLRSKTYQILSDEIRSQKSVDVSNCIPQKRAGELKLLLCKLVHEQAKLQLLHVKREKLLKRRKILANGLLESEVLLRSTFLSQKSPDVHCESLSVNKKDLQESQLDNDKVISLRKTLDHIDTRIANLTESLHKSCKMKGEPSVSDTIAYVNDYVTKRGRCQILRKDMQLWTVDHLESMDGCRCVVLNYLDLMTQRLTVNAGLAPSISILHELNNVKISMLFKDMDACTAFGFVFNGGIKQKHIGAAILAQETQATSSLFGNLLDVLAEIQQARIDLKNLISTRFYTPIAKQLDLELCFFDLRCHKRATVTLDVSCLGRGIYPSEAVPYHIDIPTEEPQSSLSLSAGFALAFKDIELGFFRIQRLCTYISSITSPQIR
uniref:uncharacterized protein LOC122591026 n=1 Tax=Erigeron canadensis TaxID=72917 RepID=UPI001CB88F80|nr:uncharacterized protein LOC122591026 [Erigeron canadensis]